MSEIALSCVCVQTTPCREELLIRWRTSQTGFGAFANALFATDDLLAHSRQPLRWDYFLLARRSGTMPARPDSRVQLQLGSQILSNTAE